MGGRKMKRYWLVLGSLVVLGCAGPPEGPAVDLEAERSALMKADEAWFESHADVDEFLSFLADDAIFMPDDAPWPAANPSVPRGSS
jgi:hypothetical protein